jgi:tetratricopeptide (TPR) repeat protein
MCCLGSAARLVLASGLFLVPLLAWAEGQGAQPPVPWGESREAQPYVYDAAVLERIPKAFLADHVCCYLLVKDDYRLDPEGYIQATHHYVARVNLRSGIGSMGDWPLPFDSTCETVMLNAARLHKPDGRVVDVAPEDIHVRDENTDYLNYDLTKNVVVSFSNLETGDVVEVKYTRKRLDGDFPGHLYGTQPFYDENYPVARGELVVRVPAARTLRYRAFVMQGEPEVETAAGYRLYRWVKTNTEPVVKPENLPGDEEYFPAVAYSTFSNWDEIAAIERKVRGANAICTPELADLIARLTAQCTTPLEKAKSLAQYTRDEVRYLSINHGAHGYRPHAPAIVMAKRYGNCYDKSHLLQTMLREVGISSSLAFINTDAEPQIVADVPSPEASHVLLLVELEGRKHWLDPTATYTVWNQLRRDLFGRRAFVIGEDGPVRLLTTPEKSAEWRRVETERTITVRTDGSAQWKIRQTFSDHEAALQRETLLDSPPEKRRQEVLKEYLDYYPKAELSELRLNLAELHDIDSPLRIDLRLETPELVREGYPPLVNVYYPALWTRLYIDVAPDRKLPLRFDPVELKDRTIVRLPRAYVWAGVPVPQEVRSRFGFALFERIDRDDPRELEIHWHVRLDGPVVQPGELAEFQTFLDQAKALMHAAPQLGIAGELGLADKVLVMAELSDKNLSPRAAAVIAELLLANGDHTSARYAIQAGLERDKTHQRLWELKAQAAEDEKTREPILRDMIQRWPDHPQYKIDLGHCLVAQERFEETVKVVQALHEDHPDAASPDTQYVLGKSLLKLNRVSEAQPLLVASVLGGLQHEWALAALTAIHIRERQVYSANGRLAELVRARSDAEALLCAELDEPLHPLAKGLVALETGRLRAAARHADEAVQGAPDNPLAYYLRGRVRFERQQDGAVDDLQRAAELTKRADAVVLSALADALFEAGQREEAVTAAEQAAELEPASEPYQRQLERFRGKP